MIPRRAFAVAAATVFMVVAAVPGRADEAEAEQDWRTLETWLGEQKPKSADERKTFGAEAEKRLRAFLEKHGQISKLAHPARYLLARILTEQKKPDKALPLFEELAKADDADMKAKGRFGVVRALIDKRDAKAARVRLDPWLKEAPDDEGLKSLDEHLKKLDGLSAKNAALKKGAAAPAYGADAKGKVVLVDFFRSDAPPAKGGLARLRRLHEKWKEKGLLVVTVALDPDPKKVEELKLPWTVVSGDAAKKIALDWGVRSIPWTALVDRGGKIFQVGLRPDVEDLDREVETAVTGKAPPRKDPGLGLEGDGE